VRYVYLGDGVTDPARSGAACDPVRRRDGTCLVAVSKQLVQFASGRIVVVLRRWLRVVRCGDLAGLAAHRSLLVQGTMQTVSKPPNG
jgi:hypothetical protein